MDKQDLNVIMLCIKERFFFFSNDQIKKIKLFFKKYCRASQLKQVMVHQYMGYIFPTKQRLELVDLRGHYLLYSCSIIAHHQRDSNLGLSARCSQQEITFIEGGAQGRQKTLGTHSYRNGTKMQWVRVPAKQEAAHNVAE